MVAKIKTAIITFPGTNCERDLHYGLTQVLGADATYIRHDQPVDLRQYQVIFLPGGSSYGDRGAPGQLAAKTPIIDSLRQADARGQKIVGICNGFQILTQAGLLPGKLLQNPSGKFICKTVPVLFAPSNTRINLPIAHLSGNYQCTPQEAENMQVVLTYQEDINGSINKIAGISNKAGNILGLMPHPERALESILGNTDGLKFFEYILQQFSKEKGN